MGMTLRDSRMSDRHKMCILKIFNISRPTISHPGSQPSYVLNHDFPEIALEGDPTFDTFRYQFFDIVFHILEIPIFRTAIHRADGPHTPIGFEFASFIYDGFSWSFIHPRKQGASHDRI